MSKFLGDFPVLREIVNEISEGATSVRLEHLAVARIVWNLMVVQFGVVLLEGFSDLSLSRVAVPHFYPLESLPISLPILFVHLHLIGRFLALSLELRDFRLSHTVSAKHVVDVFLGFHNEFHGFLRYTIIPVLG